MSLVCQYYCCETRSLTRQLFEDSPLLKDTMTVTMVMLTVASVQMDDKLDYIMASIPFLIVSVQLSLTHECV